MNRQPGRVQDLARTTPTAGCYAVPIRFMYGTAAEIDFWDVVFYRAHQENGTFETSTHELSQQTGLTRQTVGQFRRQAIAAGELKEDSSLTSGRCYVLQVPDFETLTRGVLWKPLNYIRNQWHSVITPAIPKRVLNLYFQQPRQSLYQLSTQYIAAKCKRRFWNSKERTEAALNLADIGKALRLLVQLGVFIPEDDGYRLAWDTFSHPPTADEPVFEDKDPRQHPLFIRAAVQHPERAALTLELLDVGNYDLDTHFMEIFRDLVYVRPEDQSMLKAKVYRRRNRPPSTKRWHDTWMAFQRALQRRETRALGEKCHLSLDKMAYNTGKLSIDLSAVSNIVAAWVVSRVEWPWHAATSSPKLNVCCTVNWHEDVLQQWNNLPGDTEKRVPIPTSMWQSVKAGVLTLNLAAQSECVLPGVHVEAWIEVCLRK